MTDDTYLVFRREYKAEENTNALWEELGEVTAPYAEKAAQQVAQEHGAGAYLLAPVDGAWAAVRWTVTARTEYDVAKVEPEPTAPEPFVQAVEPPF